MSQFGIFLYLFWVYDTIKLTIRTVPNDNFCLKGLFDMARTPRNECKSQYYHILIEGRSNADIFENPEDKRKLLDIVERVLEESKVALYAYCIMADHAHFVVREGSGSISRFMKRVNGAYAVYYNRKYQERGQVFFDRFKSETICDMEQLMRVIRFVHNNPVNSGLVPKQWDYPWSSYRQYVFSGKFADLLHKDPILVWFSRNREDALKEFMWFMMEKNWDIYMDLEKSVERNIKNMIESYLRKNHIELEELGYKENVLHRDYLIRMVKASGGLSIRRIAELLQLNRGTVYNVLSRND